MRLRGAAKRLRRVGCALALGTAIAWSPAPACAQLPPPPPPPTTLWSFMGVPQGYRWFRDNAFNRNGNRPGLERQPPLKAIADPRNLASPDPAIKKAAEVKQAEDLKKQKIKAIRYLASIGCGCYNRDGSITDAMMKAMDDCTEEVRWAAVTAISEAASGEMCANCKQKSCCSEEITKKLYQIAYEHDETGCFLEPSERVRTAAIEAMRVCCPGGGEDMIFESGPAPAAAQPLPPEQPSVLPPAGVERPAVEPAPGIPVPPVPPVPGAAPLVPPQAATRAVPPVLGAEAAVAKVEQNTAAKADVKSAGSKPAEKPAPRTVVLPAAKTLPPNPTITTARRTTSHELAAPSEPATPRKPAAETTESKPQSEPRPQPQRSSRRTASLLATARALNTDTNSGKNDVAAAEPTSPAAAPAASIASPAAPAVESGDESTRQAVARSIHILAPASQAMPIGTAASPEAGIEQTPAKPTVTVRLAGTSMNNEQAPATLAPIVTAASMRRLPSPVAGATEARGASQQAGPTAVVPAPSSRRNAQSPIRIGVPVTR